MAEGAIAEIIAACCGGAALAAWAFQLGASPTLIGVLWGLSYFSQLLQLPAAWITSLFGRRRVSIWGHAASRLVLLCLVPLPFLALSAAVKQALLVSVLFASACFVVIGHNAWLVWVTDLVPARIRGRFFGKRTAYATTVGTSVAILVGFLLDRAREHGDASSTLATMALVGWCAGLLTTWLMSKQHEPGGEDTQPMHLRDLLFPLSNRPSRRLLAYQILWNGSVGLTASVAAVYMLRELSFGFVGVGVYNAMLAVARIISSPFWGRAIDRFGSKPILILCAVGAAFSSALWIFAQPGWLWVIGVEAVLSGLLLAGHEVALFAIPMAVAPRTGRPVYLAAFAMVAGLAFGLASTVGGAASGVLEASTLPLGLRLLFIVSSLGRIASALVGRTLVEPNARPLSSAFDAAFSTLRRAQRGPLAKAAPSPQPVERSTVSGM